MDGVLEMTRSKINIEQQMYDEMKIDKGDESFNTFISMLYMFYRIFTAENKLISSYVMTRASQSIFIGGFLYRKLCEKDGELFFSTLNLVEDLTITTFKQLALIMIQLVEKQPQFQNYHYLAKELEKDIYSAQYAHVIDAGAAQDLFELGVAFHV